MGNANRSGASATRESAAGAMFELCRVSKHYAGVEAVHELSIAFERGATTALIGSSGSGKSTVLRLLIGLALPDRGEVRFEGRPLDRSALAAVRQKLGYVIQDGGLFPHLTALGNLALLPRHLGWASERIRSRAAELAHLTHLPTDALQRFPAELSGGQRQRVALMRALMLDPPALLLDEPLGALDPIVRHELQDQLRQLIAELDKTVVLVTHDVAEAAYLAPRLLLMRNGQVVQEGSCRDLQAHPADDFVRHFLQSTRALPEAGA